MRVGLEAGEGRGRGMGAAMRPKTLRLVQLVAVLVAVCSVCVPGTPVPVPDMEQSGAKSGMHKMRPCLRQTHVRPAKRQASLRQ
jgi:hypothetical protein